MASILTKIFSSISNNNSSSSSSSKKRSSGEISSSLTKEQINMWVEASKNVNNLNRTVTIHGSHNPYVLRRITDTGTGEGKITMSDIVNKPTDRNVDFGYKIPEGIILVETVGDGVMFANGQTDVEILIHRSIPHWITGKFKTITNEERYTVYPHKGKDESFEYAVPTTVGARNQDDEEKNEYQMAWSLGVDEENKTHDYYKYTPYKMEGNDGLWDDDQIEKRWWWDQEGPLVLLRNTHIYFPGDITYNKILEWDNAGEFNVFKMFNYTNQTNNKLYKQGIHENLYNNALEEGVDTEEITAKIQNDEQFYMKYGEDYGAYTFGNKHRPEIEVLEIDEKINKDTHFRDKNGDFKDITTRELIDAFEKIYKPTKENPMILYMNSCIPDIKARNIKDGDAFMRDQRAKIREIFKTVISKQPNKKDILRSLKQENQGMDNKWFLEEARAMIEEQNTVARNKADEAVDKFQNNEEAEQSVIINLQKHKLWKSGRDKFIVLRNHLANNKNKYYSEKDYPSLKWEDMPLVKREVVMFGSEERHSWYKENYGKYFKYVDNNIKNIENDNTVKNNINNGLNMLYEQSKLDSFGRLLPALWKKVEKYEYLKSIWINNRWEQLEKSSELKKDTYAKNLAGGGGGRGEPEWKVGDIISTDIDPFEFERITIAEEPLLYKIIDTSYDGDNGEHVVRLVPINDRGRHMRVPRHHFLSINNLKGEPLIFKKDVDATSNFSKRSSSGGGGKKRQPELGEMTWFKVYQRQVVGMRKNSNNEIEVQLQPKIGNVDVFHLNPFRPWEKWSDCSLEQPNDEMIYIQKIKDIKIIKNIIHQSLYDMGLEPLRYTEQHYKDEIDFLDKLEKAQTEIEIKLNALRDETKKEKDNRTQHGGHLKKKPFLKALWDEEKDYDDFNTVLREDVEDNNDIEFDNETTFVESWQGIDEDDNFDVDNINFFLSGIGPGDLNGHRVDINTDENRKLLTEVQREHRWLVIDCQGQCDNFVRFRLPEEYDINNNDSILDFLITKDWYEGGNIIEGGSGICVNSSLTETTLLCPDCRDDIVECAECDCECFENDLRESPVTKNKLLCITCYQKDVDKMVSRNNSRKKKSSRKRKRKKSGGGKRNKKTRKKRGGNLVKDGDGYYVLYTQEQLDKYYSEGLVQHYLFTITDEDGKKRYNWITRPEYIERKQRILANEVTRLDEMSVVDIPQMMNTIGPSEVQDVAIEKVETVDKDIERTFYFDKTGILRPYAEFNV
jgi:hypothetical protein